MRNCIKLAIMASLLMIAMPAIASDYTLKIFGNANLDDTIDGADLAYVNDIINGTKKATNLADANLDGIVDSSDLVQIRSIIDGNETQIGLIDMANRTVKVPRPSKRIVLADLLDGMNTLVHLGAKDTIVGIADGIRPYGFGQLTDHKPNSWWTPLQMSAPELKDLPTVGNYDDPNLEKIISLKPDVVFSYGVRNADLPNTIQDKTGIPTVSLVSIGGSTWANFNDSLNVYRVVGWVVGKEKTGYDLISYADGKLGLIRSVTSKIPESEKPKVYMAGWADYLTKTPLLYDPIDIAGGNNVAKGAGTKMFQVDVSKEQIIKWNPDIIILHRPPTTKANVLWKNNRSEILKDPDLQTVSAVKNGRVYYTKGFAYGWDPAAGIAETFYLAKLFHPEKFKDLDVEKEGNEVMKRFYGVDGIWTEISDRIELYKQD